MLKDLIATDGEAVAAKVIREFRFSGDAREQLYKLVRDEVDKRVRNAFKSGLQTGKGLGFERAGGRFIEL